LKHPLFNPQDVTKNVRQVRSWRTRLPLQQIHSHTVAISPKNTPSTSTLTKQAFMFSLHETIERVLNDPFLISKMYFGPGVRSDERSEFWHGDVWKSSPLFGEDSINIRGGLMSTIL